MTGEIISVEIDSYLTTDAKYKVVFGVEDTDHDDGFPFEPVEYILEISPKSNEWTNWSRYLEPGMVLTGLKEISWREGHIDPTSNPKTTTKTDPNQSNEQSFLF